MKLLIQLDDTGAAELDRAAKIIDVLGRGFASTRTWAAGKGSARPSKVATWFRRLGKGSREFWKLAARHSRSNAEWTFDDLAEGSKKERDRLRSNHRNSHRAIKAEGASNPLVSRWDSQTKRMIYSMSDAVRDEILRLAAV